MTISNTLCTVIAIGSGGEGGRVRNTQQIHHPSVVRAGADAMSPSCDKFIQPSRITAQRSEPLRITWILPAEERRLLFLFFFFGGEIALNAVYSSTDISTYGNWVVHYRYVSRLVLSLFLNWTICVPIFSDSDSNLCAPYFQHTQRANRAYKQRSCSIQFTKDKKNKPKKFCISLGMCTPWSGQEQ